MARRPTAQQLELLQAVAGAGLGLNLFANPWWVHRRAFLTMERRGLVVITGAMATLTEAGRAGLQAG